MTRMRHRTILALVCVLGSAGGIARAAAEASPTALSDARRREVLADALRDYDEATNLMRGDPARAQQLYRQSAAGFEALIAAGVANPHVEYNLGNAYFRSGDLGRAVVHYRRALRYDPGDIRVLSNLRFARERVEPSIPASGQSRLAETIFFWHYGTSLGRRFEAGGALAIAGWALLFAWLRWRRGVLASIGIVCVALSVGAWTSVLYDLRERAARPDAVVLDRQMLRLGRGETADPALKQPLGPGVEVRVLQQRGEWVEVRLANDLSGWLPAAAVAAI